MNLQDYINARPQKKIKADIIQRWNERIEPRGLQRLGADGARLYLRDYGKSIAAPKCLQFGALALANGYVEFGHEFYRKAAELERVEISGNPNVDQGANAVLRAGIAAVALVRNEPISGFPDAFQPGRFSPMQPVDAARDRKHYIERPAYWGQPKIDGQKLIVFATPFEVYYQSRTGKLSSAPDLYFDGVLKQAARQLGNFVLEGELTFLDSQGKEHRTGSQAATASAEQGIIQFIPTMRYLVFSCIWRAGAMLRAYGDMVDEGYYIANFIWTQGFEQIAPVITAKTTDQKAALAANQQAEGREGEVWFERNVAYRPGKHKDDSFIRTKYLTEFEADVIGFTETTAEGHAFGAMEIADTAQGHYYGNVGTGFTRQDKWDLLARFRSQGSFRVKVRSQGFTEDGKAFLARFLEIVE